MKRRRVILLVMSACFLAALVAILWPREKEPEYKGKTLTQWLNIYQDGLLGRVDDAKMKEAWEAVQAIGTNALPVLLKQIAGETPAWRRKLTRFLPFNPSGWAGVFGWWTVKRSVLSADTSAEAAVNGFQLLGEAASPAVPELSRLIYAGPPTVSDHAMQSLMMIGENGYDSLLAALTNRANGVGVRSKAAFYLAYAAGTNVLSAVQILCACVDDLSNPPGLRYSSIWALGALKGAAQEGAPTLTRALSDPDADVSSAATNALWQISQGVVESEQTAAKEGN